MTVYVDDARIKAKVGRIDAEWSHLFADSQDELHEFAASIGLQRRWFQPGKSYTGKPSRFWHYDVTESKRMQAIRAGAKPVTSRESITIMDERDGVCGCPRDWETGACPHCGNPGDHDHRNRCHRAAAGSE